MWTPVFRRYRVRPWNLRFQDPELSSPMIPHHSFRGVFTTKLIIKIHDEYAKPIRLKIEAWKGLSTDAKTKGGKVEWFCKVVTARLGDSVGFALLFTACDHFEYEIEWNSKQPIGLYLSSAVSRDRSWSDGQVFDCRSWSDGQVYYCVLVKRLLLSF